MSNALHRPGAMVAPASPPLAVRPRPGSGPSAGFEAALDAARGGGAAETTRPLRQRPAVRDDRDDTSASARLQPQTATPPVPGQQTRQPKPSQQRPVDVTGRAAPGSTGGTGTRQASDAARSGGRYSGGIRATAVDAPTGTDPAATTATAGSAATIGPPSIALQPGAVIEVVATDIGSGTAVVSGATPTAPGVVTPGAVTPGAVTPGAVTPGAVTPGDGTPGAGAEAAVAPFGPVTPGAADQGSSDAGGESGGAGQPPTGAIAGPERHTTGYGDKVGTAHPDIGRPAGAAAGAATGPGTEGGPGMPAGDRHDGPTGSLELPATVGSAAKVDATVTARTHDPESATAVLADPAGTAADMSTSGTTTTGPSAASGLSSPAATSATLPGPGLSIVATPATAGAVTGATAGAAPAVVGPFTLAQLSAVPGIVTTALSTRGSHQLMVELSPAALGPVRVRATLRDGAVSIELAGGADVAREAMRAVLSDLAASLADAGIDADVTLQDATFGGADAETAGGPPGEGERRPVRQPAGPNGPVDDPTVTGPRPAPVHPGTTARLDVRV